MGMVVLTCTDRRAGDKEMDIVREIRKQVVSPTTTATSERDHDWQSDFIGCCIAFGIK